MFLKNWREKIAYNNLEQVIVTQFSNDNEGKVGKIFCRVADFNFWMTLLFCLFTTIKLTTKTAGK